MTKPSTTLNRFDRQVLALVAQGFTTRRISRQVGKTEPAVRGQVQRLMGKLGARSRPHAVLLGIAGGHLVVTKDGVIPRG